MRTLALSDTLHSNPVVRSYAHNTHYVLRPPRSALGAAAVLGGFLSFLVFSQQP